MLGRCLPQTPLRRVEQGLVLGLLLVLHLVVPIPRRVQAPVSRMTSLTTERAVPVAGSVLETFEDLNALFCVCYEPCSSGGYGRGQR